MGKPVEVRVLSRAVTDVDGFELVIALRRARDKLSRDVAPYLCAAAFLLAAQRAFISWESFLLPAGVSPPFFFLGVATFLPALILAQRALVAAASFARVAADTGRFPTTAAGRAPDPDSMAERRFSRLSI
jgi:hypothetical protein